MLVNLNKLIASLLPTFLRSNKLITIIQVLSSQLEAGLNWFVSMVPAMKRTANINASVISLEYHIRREFDCDVVISPLDGRPFDFLVSVSGFVDFDKLRSFVDKYKIAGKTFIFEEGEVTYTAEFVNHVCEWERDDVLITANLSAGKIWATAAVNVCSDINVVIRTVWSGGATVMYTVSIAKGQSVSNEITLPSGTVTFYEVNDVSPSYDNKYSYDW